MRTPVFVNMPSLSLPSPTHPLITPAQCALALQRSAASLISVALHPSFHIRTCAVEPSPLLLGLRKKYEVEKDEPPDDAMGA